MFVWAGVRSLCFDSPALGLDSELRWGVQHYKGDSVRSVMYKLCLSASVLFPSEGEE